MFAILHGWRLEGMPANLEVAFTRRAGALSVGASLLAINLRAPRGAGFPALSLTTIASRLAPTVICASEPDGVPEWVAADMVDEACA